LTLLLLALSVQEFLVRNHMTVVPHPLWPSQIKTNVIFFSSKTESSTQWEGIWWYCDQRKIVGDTWWVLTTGLQ
jgi:hypothetical protein